MKLTLNIDTMVKEELHKAKGFIEHLLGLAPTPTTEASPSPAPAALVAPAPAAAIPPTPPAPAPAAPAGGVTHEQVKARVTAWLSTPGNTAATLQAIYAECGAPNVAKATPEQLAFIMAKLG